MRCDTNQSVLPINEERDGKLEISIRYEKYGKNVIITSQIANF